MKNIFLITAISLTTYLIQAQNLNIDCLVKAYNDTAPAITTHLKYQIGFNYSNNDTVFIDTQNSNLEIKFPVRSNDWHPIKSLINLDDFPPSKLNKVKEDRFLNLVPFLVKDDTLLNLLQNIPNIVIIRYHFMAQKKGEALADYYSNQDTIFLGYPNSDEINSIKYIRSTSIDPFRLINISTIYTEEQSNAYIYIRDFYPNSILAEMAKLILFEDEIINQCQSIDSGYFIPVLVRQRLNTKISEFGNSQSELVRREATEFLQIMNEQQH